jgi:hypothetical protein
VLDDQRLARTLGDGGARRAREFDWEVVSKSVLGIYEDVLVQQRAAIGDKGAASEQRSATSAEQAGPGKG